MMTLAEVHLLTNRRITAIRWTIDSLTRELATLEADAAGRPEKAKRCFAFDPPAMPDSRKSEMADS